MCVHSHKERLVKTLVVKNNAGTVYHRILKHMVSLYFPVAVLEASDVIIFENFLTKFITGVESVKKKKSVCFHLRRTIKSRAGTKTLINAKVWTELYVRFVRVGTPLKHHNKEKYYKYIIRTHTTKV